PLIPNGATTSPIVQFQSSYIELENSRAILQWERSVDGRDDSGVAHHESLDPSHRLGDDLDVDFTLVLHRGGLGHRAKGIGDAALLPDYLPEVVRRDPHFIRGG